MVPWGDGCYLSRRRNRTWHGAMAAGLCGNRARFSAMDFWCRVAFLFGRNGGGKNDCGSLWHEAESFSNACLGLLLLGGLFAARVAFASVLAHPCCRAAR